MHRCLLILVVPLSLMFHTACSSETELSSSNSSSNGNNLLPNDHSTDESSSSKDGDVVLEPVMINGSFLTCSLSEDNVTLTCQGSLDQEEMESIVFLDDDGSIDFTVSSLESNKFQIVLAREANQDSLVVQPEKKYIVLWDVEYYQGYHIKIDVTDLQVGEELTWDNLIIDSNFPDDQWFSDNSLTLSTKSLVDT